MEHVNLVTSMSWAPRGNTRPNIEKVKYTQEDLVAIVKELKLKEAEYESRPGAKKCPTSMQEESENENGDGDNDMYDLENYDNESSETMPSHPIETLILENTPDTDSEDSDAEPDEFSIQPMDNLMLAAHVEDDIHTLEVYIFNDTRGELFLLHDILLPSEPMVVEYLNYYKEDSSTRFNLAAVGCMDAEINIWDLNVSGCLEPKLRIGGPKAKKDFRHTDAVLALAWAKDSRRILASGSADNTVRIWDMSDGDEIHKHTGFEKYVQCINWHPEETVLLAGSADKKLRLLDCRSDNMSKEWTLESGVECVQWNHHGFQYFLASTSDGFISYYDIRGSKKPMWNLKAHDSDCIFALSTHCRELMISGSHDETVKVWNMENSPFTNSVPELVTVKHMNIGPILSLKANPDVSYVFCAGGMKKDNYLYVWDVRESEDVMKCFAESGSRGIKIRSRQKHEYGNDLTPEELQRFYRKGTFEPKPGPSSGDTTENNWGRIKFKNKKKSRTVKVYVTDPPDTTSTEPVAGPSSASTERPPPPREHKKMHPKTKGGGKRKKEREINKKKK